MRVKSDTAIHIKNFLHFVKTQYQTDVIIICSGNGAKFSVHIAAICLRRRGFCINLVVLGYHNKMVLPNGSTIMLNMVRALRFQASLPFRYWGFCVLTAAYLILLWYAVLHGKSPFEVLHNRKPSLDHLHSFGWLCYAANFATRDKFAARRHLQFSWVIHPRKRDIYWLVYNLRQFLE